MNLKLRATFDLMGSRRRCMLQLHRTGEEVSEIKSRKHRTVGCVVIILVTATYS